MSLYDDEAAMRESLIRNFLRTSFKVYLNTRLKNVMTQWVDEYEPQVLQMSALIRDPVERQEFLEAADKRVMEILNGK